VARFARLDQLSAAAELHERQSRPVLVPAVDEDRGARVRDQVSDAPKRVNVDASFRLLVER
jgi:hypothetical protein